MFSFGDCSFPSVFPGEACCANNGARVTFPFHLGFWGVNGSQRVLTARKWLCHYSKCVVPLNLSLKVTWLWLDLNLNASVCVQFTAKHFHVYIFKIKIDTNKRRQIENSFFQETYWKECFCWTSWPNAAKRLIFNKLHSSTAALDISSCRINCITKIYDGWYQLGTYVLQTKIWRAKWQKIQIDIRKQRIVSNPLYFTTVALDIS